MFLCRGSSRAARRKLFYGLKKSTNGQLASCPYNARFSNFSKSPYEK